MPKVARKAMRYMDTIDAGGGVATRMNLLLIEKNNETNLNRAIRKLTQKYKWIEEIQDSDGRRRYRKTARGDRMQKALKEHGDFEELIDELSGDRFKSDDEDNLPK